jgi:hypothetical protein
MAQMLLFTAFCGMQYERMLPAGFYSSFLSFSVGKTYSFAIFGWCVSLCELQTRLRNGQVCMAFELAFWNHLIF